MIDGIVVQPATGHWCTVGRPSKVAAGRSLPSLSLAGISSGNRGRLAILHTKRAVHAHTPYSCTGRKYSPPWAAPSTLAATNAESS